MAIELIKSRQLEVDIELPQCTAINRRLQARWRSPAKYQILPAASCCRSGTLASGLLVVALALGILGMVPKAEAQWASVFSDSSEYLDRISCNALGFCMAVGGDGTNGVVITSTDFGQTWTHRTPPNDASGFYEIYGVFCMPEATGGTSFGSQCWVGGTDNDGNNVISNSEDGGKSWTLQNANAASSQQADEIFAISCIDSKHCVAVGEENNRGVSLSTTNGGTSWSYDATSGFGRLSGVSCAYDYQNKTQACWAVGEPTPSSADSAIWKTTTVPAVWVAESVPNLGRTGDISCPTVTDCWATAAGGVLRSSNGGASWTVQISGSVSNISCPVPQNCYASTSSGFIATDDGGRTWIDQSVPAGDEPPGFVSCNWGGGCVAQSNKTPIGFDVLLYPSNPEPEPTPLHRRPSNTPSPKPSPTPTHRASPIPTHRASPTPTRRALR